MPARNWLGAAVAVALMAAGSTAMADGDAKAGEKIFKKCKACHTLVEGKNKIGPSLYGVIGRTAGTLESFTKYSDAMKESGIVWSAETIDQYLSDPKGFIPKNKMAFRGLKKESDRENVIAHIEEATDE